MSRFYIDLPLQLGVQLILPESIAHHLRVLRMEVGALLVLFNGLGGEYEARVIRVEKRSVTVLINTYHPIERESLFDLTLVQSISSPERMDYTVQKSAELGVALVQPVVSQYSQRHYVGQDAEKRVSRWQHIAVGACEQSGRTRLVKVQAVLKYEDYLKTGQEANLKLLLSPARCAGLDELPVTAQSAIVLIGPEGGFSAEEEELGITSGFIPLTLGPRILRTETVAPVIAALLQSRYGDVGKTLFK